MKVELSEMQIKGIIWLIDQVLPLMPAWRDREALSEFQKEMEEYIDLNTQNVTGEKLESTRKERRIKTS